MANLKTTETVEIEREQETDQTSLLDNLKRIMTDEDYNLFFSALLAKEEVKRQQPKTVKFCSVTLILEEVSKILASLDKIADNDEDKESFFTFCSEAINRQGIELNHIMFSDET